MGFVPFISFKNNLGTICTPFVESVKTPKFKEKHVALGRKCRRSSPGQLSSCQSAIMRTEKYSFPNKCRLSAGMHFTSM